jgi:hypothetical protein
MFMSTTIALRRLLVASRMDDPLRVCKVAAGKAREWSWLCLELAS